MTDLPTSPGDDAVELASRYVDGDLSVDERAAAESDPEVMAWVERFGGIQEALREPVDVDASMRDAAIVAALAAIDDAAPSESAPPPGGDELAAARARRAGRMSKWLGAAAAAVAVAIGGAVLAGNSGGSDDSADEKVFSASAQMDTTDAASDQTQLTEEPAQRTMSAPAPAAADDATAVPESAAAGESGATTTAAGGDVTSAPAEQDAGTTGGAATETTAGTATTTVTESATSAESYANAAELQQLADAPPVTVADGTEPPCAEEASGELVDPDVLFRDQPAVVYRDVQNHTLTAWAVDTCEALAEYTYAEE